MDYLGMLITGASTCIGILITAIVTTKIHKSGLAHDTKERALEREIDIRREVYLEAMAALIRTHQSVINISNLMNSEQDITSNMLKDSGILAKVQIVGSFETIKALLLLTSKIGNSVLELMPERARLEKGKNKIARHYKQVEMHRAGYDCLIDMVRNLCGQGNINEDLLVPLNRKLEFEKKEIDKYIGEYKELLEKQYEEEKNFKIICLNKKQENSTHLPNLVLLVRKELGLEIDEDAYLELCKNIRADGQKTLEGFIEKLESGND